MKKNYINLKRKCEGKNKIIFGLAAIFMVLGKASFSETIIHDEKFDYNGSIWKIEDNHTFNENAEIIGNNNQYGARTDGDFTITIADDKKLKIESTYRTEPANKGNTRAALLIEGKSDKGDNLNIIGNKADVEILTVQGASIKVGASKKSALTIDSRNLTLIGGAGIFLSNGEATLTANQEINIEINNEITESSSDTQVGIFAQVNSKLNLKGETINIKNTRGGIFSAGSTVETNGNSLNIISSKSYGVYSKGNNSKVSINNKTTNISGEDWALFVNEGGEIELTETGKHVINGDIEAKVIGSAINIKGDKGNIINSNIFAHNQGKVNVSTVNGELTGDVYAYDEGTTTISAVNGKLTGDVKDYNLGYPGREGVIALDLTNGLWENNKNSSSVSEVVLTNGNIKFAAEKGIHIGTLDSEENKNGTFYMKVDSENLEKGNMLYVQNSTGGKYNVNLTDSNLANFNVGDKIRFATIGKNAKDNELSFEVNDILEKGIKDIVLETKQSDYIVGDQENDTYNKFDSNALDEKFQDGENWYIERVESNMNDIAKTIVEASKANYASAVYMDNLNKRLGDMSFVNGMDGLWVRMRNDRVGEDDQYRLHNYMTQIGYDKEYTMDNGLEYRGIAFEYGKGDMDYKELKADSNIDRYILTLYDTRVRNNGVYTDYVLRGGAIHNDFTVYGRETGAKAEGKYKNMLLGAGVEVGKRFDSNNWYFEPQTQLQYTFINSTDYKTNQNTKVELDEIHSLIGRAGFRLGYDFYKENSKENTVYVKADINHEFLGDQKIKATDVTGTLDKTYHNDETWYDIGIGAAKKITPDFNVYMDVEKQFGTAKDNNSWQFNLGFRYRFGGKAEQTQPKLTPVTKMITSLKADNYFDFDKSELKPEGKAVIKETAEIINSKNLEGTILIEGHTDSKGAEEYNQKLSERRAEAVQTELKNNINNENIKYETKGYGESQPIADNTTEEGRAQNRRVEIKYENR